MDRSQVRQFGVRNSIYNSKIMGINSILHSPRMSSERQMHLRKSRITNIPDTKHINLSDKLDMVVIFQTIQIQRLSDQVETLRVRVRQYERQVFNCDHYEIQIKQLTEKCFRLQSQKNSYREELFDNKQASEMIFNQLEEIKKKYITVDFTTNQKYKLEKTKNDELMFEVQKWKARYNALDESKSKQLQMIKKMMQQQSKSYLSRQTKQLFDRFETEKEDMEQLIKSLKQTNIQKQTQLKKLKFELQNNQKLLQDLQKQVDQYQEKVALLSQQNYRLSQLTKSKQNQINRLKDKLKENQQITSRINQQITTKTQQNKKLNTKITKIQESLNQKDIKLNKFQKNSLNDKERLSELDRIVFLLKQRENQIESKNKIIERKDHKVSTLEEELKILQETQNETKKQITNLKQQNISSAQMIKALLQRIQRMSKLQQTIKKSAQTSFSKIDNYISTFKEEVNQKTQTIINFSQKMIEEISQNQSYIQKLQEINKGTNDKIASLQNEKLQALDKMQEFRQLQQRYRVIERQNQNLKRNIQRLFQQRNELIQQAQNKQFQIMNQTQIQLRVMQDKYENNVIKSLKQQLFNKQKSLNQIKNTCIMMQKKVKEFQKQAKNIEQSSKKIIENSNIDWDRKLNMVNNQLNQKSEQLTKQRNTNDYLRHSLENFFKFYQQNVQKQIQLVLERIQPLETIIRKLKIFVFEKLIKRQENLIQIQKSNQQKISQVMEKNVTLMQNNLQIFDSLISGKQFNFNLSNVENNVNNNFINQDNVPNPIYTTGTLTTQSQYQITRNNENYNSLNVNGVGSKIKQATIENVNKQSFSQIPTQFLIKHVLMCIELESLRQRIGDKNAKVQKIKNSLMVSNVSSNKSFVAIVNGNTKDQTHHVTDPQGSMMLESNLMSQTIINKLGNPFMNSVIRSINNQNSVIHQSRLIEMTERTSRIQPQLNIRRVISEDRFTGKSPDNSSIHDDSLSKNQGIYTKRLSGGSGLGRNGFKSIGIKRSTVYY